MVLLKEFSHFLILERLLINTVFTFIKRIIQIQDPLNGHSAISSMKKCREYHSIQYLLNKSISSDLYLKSQPFLNIICYSAFIIHIITTHLLLLHSIKSHFYSSPFPRNYSSTNPQHSVHAKIRIALAAVVHN